MAITPAFDAFETAYSAGKNQIVYTRLAADLDTPVSLMLKLTGAAENGFVLESVTGGEIATMRRISNLSMATRWMRCARSFPRARSTCLPTYPKPLLACSAIWAMT